MAMSVPPQVGELCLRLQMKGKSMRVTGPSVMTICPHPRGQSVNGRKRRQWGKVSSHTLFFQSPSLQSVRSVKECERDHAAHALLLLLLLPACSALLSAFPFPSVFFDKARPWALVGGGGVISCLSVSSCCEVK